MSTPWCVTCAMSSTSPRVCWTATTSSVPAAYVVGPMTAASAAPSVGKKLHCDVDEDQFGLHVYDQSRKAWKNLNVWSFSPDCIINRRSALKPFVYFNFPRKYIIYSQ